MSDKPLGHHAYGSIGHLPGSRLGPADHTVDDNLCRLLTVERRDKWDRVVIQEKYDGSACAAARLGDDILALGRAGYLAVTSPYEQHQLFAAWVAERASLFRELLQPGERLVGEWLAQAHGTRYEITDADDAWIVFDLMTKHARATSAALITRLGSRLHWPAFCFNQGRPMPPAAAFPMLGPQGCHHALDGPEGLVYRLERCDPRTKVWTHRAIAKWVRPDKVDGHYLPEISGGEPVWNWRPA